MTFPDPQTPERVVPIRDDAAGLSGHIVLHSTALGPAAGGCRFQEYADDASALHDARRLAAGMSYKNALARLPLGGGKAVLRRPEGAFDREALFRAFGRAVEQLRGGYVTAEDVGTTVADMAVVARETRHVAGLPVCAGLAGGDPSPFTAQGVFLAMQVAVEKRLGGALAGRTVAIQGVGAVGASLAGLLHEAGARLIVADRDAAAVAAVAARTGAEVASCATILQARCDVLAPCALGGVLDAAAVARLRAAVVCGAANNQLAVEADGDRLAERGILYAPDYLVNAGGIISVAGEHLGWSLAEVRRRVAEIPARLDTLLDRAARERSAPHAAADRWARELIAAATASARAA